jgi:hypothetical protein
MEKCHEETAFVPTTDTIVEQHIQRYHEIRADTICGASALACSTAMGGLYLAVQTQSSNNMLLRTWQNVSPTRPLLHYVR